MEYLGLQEQIRKNNFRSVILLCAFPALLFFMFWLFLFLVADSATSRFDYANIRFILFSPFVGIGVAIWFTIAFFAHERIIRSATGAEPLARKENKRVYNLVENLCISQGMVMPSINIINDMSLNAYASGISDKTYTVSLSKGIIERLDDEELKGVIAHELTHIKNRDVRLLIISIVFVGIFAFIAHALFRMLIYGGRSRDSKNKGNPFALIIALVLASIAYGFSLLFKLALSRKREYLADAGAAEMTKNPEALASALNKISADPVIEAVQRSDVAQLFIEHPKEGSSKMPSMIQKIFATHPPIEERISILKQF